jgi:type IV pilus assembly protein PilQ
MNFNVEPLRRILATLLLFIGGIGLPALAYSQPVVVGITTSVQEGVDVLKIDFASNAPKDAVAYTIASPTRLIIDLPTAKSALNQNKLDFAQGSIRVINVVEAADRTRLVVTLKHTALHTMSTTGNSIVVLFRPVQDQTPLTVNQAVIAEPSNEILQKLGSVDFKRIADGGGRIEVPLPSNKLGVDVKQIGPELVIEFLKSTVPDSQRRRLDVKDFGTPVQYLNTSVSGDRVRLVIEAKGAWEHTVFQSDTKLTIDIKTPLIDANKVSQGVGYTGEKLSLNFQNIEIRSLLQVIADFTNFNIITSESVSGNVTLRLKDVPWDQALDIILQTKSLGMRKSGGVLWIAPKEELAAKEKRELDAQLAIQNVEPLKTQSFQLNYTKATDIIAQLTPQTGAGEGGKGGVLSPRGSVVAEPRTNQLFVTDIASRLVHVQEMLAKLDVAVRQVLIEARIVEANDSFGKSLGVKWGAADLSSARGGQGGEPIGSTGTRIGIGATYDAATISSGQSSGSLTTTNTQLVSMPATGQGGYSPASIAVSLFSGIAGRYLNLELSALEADGKGKIVSSPRIVTADQTKALIEQGTELPYQAATASGATSVQFKKANLKLEVTPQITPEGNVILDLDVTKDSVGQSTSAGFAIDTKHIKTQVLVENGGTVVIGGIFEVIETESEARVPVLGDLPFVGNAFKSKTRKTSKQEMLVFITPKVISSGQVVR